MKNFFLFTLLSFLMLGAFAQSTSNSGFSENGDPQHERLIVDGEKSIADFLNPQILRASVNHLNPGIDPEGDYAHRMAYSGDGIYLLQANALTNNVTIFDVETMDVVANISVGFFPVDVACTDDYAIVPCVFADSVFVISLSDFSVVAAFPTGEQPAVVEVSHDGTKAFVGCDVDNVVEVIDLENLVHISSINNFPIALRSANMISGSGRFYYVWHQFLLSPDDQSLVTSNFDDAILLYDISTGNLQNQIDGLASITELNFSGDGNFLIAASYTNPTIIYQIDFDDFQVSKSVTIDGLGIWGGGIAVNSDGNKAFLGVNGNQTALVRFASEDYSLFPFTQTAFWCDNTFDHQYAISGQFRFTVFEFESELIKGYHWGNSQYLGAVSPTAYQAAGIDPGRYEGPAFFDFSDPATVDYRGRRPSGEMPEGDVPYCVAINPDGTKAVLVNNLSENVSIINIDSCLVEDVIEIGEAGYEVEITHDGHYAIVGGYDLNTIKIIDLESNTMISTVATGQRPMMIAIAPDDSYAYIGNLKSNSISFVKLDGANSVNEKTIPCGIIGVSWAAFGVRSAVEVSPGGEYLLVAASFDDNVKVIDTQSQEIVATIDVGDFPLQIAFDADGSYAVVTNYSDNTYSVIAIDGANSSHIGTFNAGNSGPIRLAYNAVKDEISIVHLSDSHIIYNIDPRTGDLLSTTSYPAFGAPSQIRFDAEGLPLVLTGPTDNRNAHLLHDGTGYELTSTPIFFDYAAEAQVAVVACGGGGQDRVSIIDFLAVGTPKFPLVKEASYKPLYITSLSPNPASQEVHIGFWKSESLDKKLQLEVKDIQGKSVFSKSLISNPFQKEITLNVSGFKPGVYFVSLSGGNYSAVKKLLVE